MNRRDKIRLLHLLIEQEEQQKKDIDLDKKFLLKLGQDVLNELKKYQLYINNAPIISGKSNNSNMRFMKFRPIHFVLKNKTRVSPKQIKRVDIVIKDPGYSKQPRKVFQKNLDKCESDIQKVIKDRNELSQLNSAELKCMRYLGHLMAPSIFLITCDNDENDKPRVLIVFANTADFLGEYNLDLKKYQTDKIDNTWQYSIEDLTVDNLDKKQKEIFNDIKHRALAVIKDTLVYINKQYVKNMRIIYNIFKKHYRLDLYEKLINR